MSLAGGGPFENDDSRQRFAKLAAEAEGIRVARAVRASGRLGSFIRRWRERRRLRRAALLERKITARENLRDFKQSTGDEPGQWTGPSF
jgi:hypothetical protein